MYVCMYVLHIYIIYNDLITQLYLVSERNSVVVGSNPTQNNFLYLLLKIIQW